MNNINYIRKKNFFTALLHSLFRENLKSRNDLLHLIHNFQHNSLIDLDTRNMLEGVIDISTQKVKDIMIPRSQIIYLKNTQPLSEQLNTIIKSAHSRFPVLCKKSDRIIGILMAKDLLPFMLNNIPLCSIDKILRPAIVVPEYKSVDKMLKEFRLQHYHMAIVIDEFGNMSGLITIEDILELIVGNIEDEYDEKNNCNIYQINQNTFVVNAVTPIIDFNKTFNTNFYNEEIDTIGGFIVQSFGHLPTYRESINILGYIFKIILMDSYRIKQLLVHTPKDSLYIPNQNTI